MDLVIENIHSLPCCLATFTVNGKKADLNDFGSKISNDGSPMKNECSYHFYPKEQTQEILNKYEIDANDYQIICDRLVRTLQINGCGWCA